MPGGVRIHRLASLARGPFHVYLVCCSAMEKNCSLSVGTIGLVAGFCWCACPGFR